LLSTYEDLLPVALDAVDLAVDVLRRANGYGRLKPKGDRDYASELDIDIERLLREHLRSATPHISFFGEEEGSRDHGTDLRWILDPIDGTVNFVHGLPLYAVSLALISEQQPVLGVIDLPALGVRFRATRGGGAFCGDEPMPVPSPPSSLASAIVAIGDYAVGNQAEEKNRARLAVTTGLAASALRVRMLGSAAIDLAWLADARLDAAVTLSNNSWDMPAGVLIARETGHAVVDADGTDYNLRSAATIAAHPEILPEVLRIVQAANNTGT
jgi:myo-inositol-1(or 4)-monophosphatase